MVSHARQEQLGDLLASEEDLKMTGKVINGLVERRGVKPGSRWARQDDLDTSDFPETSAETFELQDEDQSDSTGEATDQEKSSDSVSDYFREIARHKLLSRKEELDVSRACKQGDKAAHTASRACRCSPGQEMAAW